MNSVACVYFKSESGRCPVKEFIEALDRYSQRKFFFVVDLLSEFGRRLPEPHAKFIGNDIFELRFRGVEGSIRIMYFFFHHDEVVLTNGFIKKTDKTPANQKKLAIDRRKAYLALRKD
ncbi:MAG: type II toxin-antitoxin system RelE/ParE family toxin [Candidatus Omnitrophota bacterium]|nr:type II toxin-antitoxin system RelE/ParE family toxin [Candidatus Omnitrophota bacterium]